MKNLSMLILVSIIGSTPAWANTPQEIVLTPGDSAAFVKTLYGFENSSIQDPNDNLTVLNVRKYQSSNQALTMECTTKINSGLDMGTLCKINFDLEKSTTETEVHLGTIGGSIGATLNTGAEATQMMSNLGYKPFIASEKITVKLPNGTLYPYPRLRIDCQKDGSSNTAKSCKIVAVPDQQ